MIAERYSLTLSSWYLGWTRGFQVLSVAGTSAALIAILSSSPILVQILALGVSLAPQVVPIFLNPRRSGQMTSLAKKWARQVSEWDKLQRRWEYDGSVSLSDIELLVQESVAISDEEIDAQMPDWHWMLRRAENKVYTELGVKRREQHG